jgi:predicted alpha/beta superfamily hydrolase
MPIRSIAVVALIGCGAAFADTAPVPAAAAAGRAAGIAAGTVDTFTVAPFLSGRRCWVYLPPGYATSHDRYPVLYMHDGQNLFDARASFAGEWQVDETCDRLILAGEIPPLLVIGIDNAGAGRIREYTPWPDAARGDGGGADTYLTAIRDVLIPEVNRRFRTRTGPSNTWTAGSSLGGLVSAYAGFAYDSTFGRVAALSPSYWWGGQSLTRWAARRPRPALERFYQDMGAMERGQLVDDNANGVNDEIEYLRAMADVLRAHGFRDGASLKSYEAPGHRHHEAFWAQRLPGVLRFLATPL